MSEHDHPEADELDRAAAWRQRRADADPADRASAAAARHLQHLATELRALPDAPEGAVLLHEYRCLCNWLSESDGIQDAAQAAHDYRVAIGFGQWPESATTYLRQLIALANQSAGGM